MLCEERVGARFFVDPKSGSWSLTEGPIKNHSSLKHKSKSRNFCTAPPQLSSCTCATSNCLAEKDEIVVVQKNIDVCNLLGIP